MIPKDQCDYANISFISSFIVYFYLRITKTKHTLTKTGKNNNNKQIFLMLKLSLNFVATHLRNRKKMHKQIVN